MDTCFGDLILLSSMRKRKYLHSDAHSIEKTAVAFIIQPNAISSGASLIFTPPLPGSSISFAARLFNVSLASVLEMKIVPSQPNTSGKFSLFIEFLDQPSIHNGHIVAIS